MYFNSIAGSYNGSTAAFEAVNLGSIPSPAANFRVVFKKSYYPNHE